jgi:hypothetical protein
MLKIDKEVYKQIASAIVARWLECDKNYSRVMELMFNDRDPNRVVDNLMKDFQDAEGGVFFLGEMCLAMQPEIELMMKAELENYKHFLNVSNFDDSGYIERLEKELTSVSHEEHS